MNQPKNIRTSFHLCRSGMLLWVILNSATTLAQGPVSFPLKLHESKRYLEDKSGTPFLVKEFSAWGLIQGLPETEAAAFLDSIKRKGFNTIITGIINNNTSMAGSPPDWQGISPFNIKWDFSTPNEKYFQHVDRFFKMAGEKGFFVMILPIYMGYREDGSQGWWDELLNPNNDPAKMKKYGEFLGRRYANTPNIMWVAGGDHNCADKFFPYVNSTIEGIRAIDKGHLWTGHFDTNLGVFWSTDNPLYASIMDIDGLYVWTESVLFEKGPQYKTELERFSKGKMIIQLDQSYERDVPHYADNENYQWIRRKMYDGLLSGCAGTSFSAGQAGNQCYSFKNWRPLMNTPGMKQVSYCLDLFSALQWHTLVPDQTNDIILSGRGEFGSRDYVCASRAANGNYYVVYFPRGQVINVNVKAISGKYMRMHWFNPRTGEATRIGVAETRERFGIAPPSEDDWVLVFDNDPAFKMPGTGSFK